MKFALAKRSVPLFNTPALKEIFGGASGNLVSFEKKIETIALKGTKFSILKKVDDQIYAVKTEDYPSAEVLYVDGNFLELQEKEPPERVKREPSASLIIQHLHAIYAKNLPYLWGGNWSDGIPEMLAHYPPKKEIPEEMKRLWTLKGVDCSGLLYEATEGYTPRNTSELMFFGQGLPIEGLKAEQIPKQVKPLDLIVWKGHVVIVLDAERTIESRGGRGVIVNPLREILEDLFETKKRSPANSVSANLDPASYFLMRRWHSTFIE